MFRILQIVSQFPDCFAVSRLFRIFFQKIPQFRKDFTNSILPKINSSNQSDRGLNTKIFIWSSTADRAST